MTNTQSATLPPSADREPRSGQYLPPERGDLSVTFRGGGDHEAMQAAETRAKARGFSIGVMQADAARGMLLGDYAIAKWRNLDGEKLADLHGRMEAPGRSWRTGPVKILIRRDAPAAAVEAFNLTEDDLARIHVEGRNA